MLDSFGNIVIVGSSSLIASSIKNGVTIFGVKGTFTGWVDSTITVFNDSNKIDSGFGNWLFLSTNNDSTSLNNCQIYNLTEYGRWVISMWSTETKMFLFKVPGVSGKVPKAGEITPWFIYRNSYSSSIFSAFRVWYLNVNFSNSAGSHINNHPIANECAWGEFYETASSTPAYTPKKTESRLLSRNVGSWTGWVAIVPWDSMCRTICRIDYNPQ